MNSKKSRDRALSRAEQSCDVRRERLEHLMLGELRSILKDQAADPDLLGVQLVKLNLSPDGSHARVAYAARSFAPEPEVARRTRAALEKASGFLRARLGAALELKRLPMLGFTFIGVVLADIEEGGEPCQG